MPGRSAADGAVEGNLLPGQQDLAGIAPVDPEQDPGDLRPAGAHEAGEAEDLARPDREADIAEGVAPGQALDLQEHVAERCLAFGNRRDGPADHVADQVGGRELARRCRDHEAAVAEDRRLVAQLEDLVEAVADEQDRDAAVAQPADDREQALDLVERQRRRRLIEDQDAAPRGRAPWRSR